MLDDILVNYASAQIMVANETKTTSASVTMKALQIGEGEYIIAIAILNAVLFLVVIEEAIRTRGWKTLTDFNYMSPRNLILGSSRGGSELANMVDTKIAEEAKLAKEEGTPYNWAEWGDWGESTSRAHRTRIVHRGSRIVLASES